MYINFVIFISFRFNTKCVLSAKILTVFHERICTSGPFRIFFLMRYLLENYIQIYICNIPTIMGILSICPYVTMLLCNYKVQPKMILTLIIVQTKNATIPIVQRGITKPMAPVAFGADCTDPAPMGGRIPGMGPG